MESFRRSTHSARTGEGGASRLLISIVEFVTSTTTLSIAGLGLLSYGAHLAWHPAGFIVLGSGLLAEGVWQAVEENRRERIPGPGGAER